MFASSLRPLSTAGSVGQSGRRLHLELHDATTADGGLAFRTERNSVPVTNRARTSSPRRHVLAQTRRTEPQGVNATAKISGTTIAPTSRQRPLAETVRIKHSIQGASGPTMINPTSSARSRRQRCGSLSPFAIARVPAAGATGLRAAWLRLEQLSFSLGNSPCYLLDRDHATIVIRVLPTAAN